jgi:preprotein translocase subunit SecD
LCGAIVSVTDETCPSCGVEFEPENDNNQSPSLLSDTNKSSNSNVEEKIEDTRITGQSSDEKVNQIPSETVTVTPNVYKSRVRQLLQEGVPEQEIIRKVSTELGVPERVVKFAIAGYKASITRNKTK